MKVNRRVFDAHFHIGAWGTQEFAGHVITPMPGSTDRIDDHATGADCAAYLKRHNIAGGLAVPTYLDRSAAAFEFNQALLQAVEQYKNLYGGLWVSPLPEVEDLNAQSLACLPHPSIRALKIASNNWFAASGDQVGINPSSWTARVRKNVEAILTTAVQHQLVIHFHTGYLSGADPLEFEEFMAEYGTAATYQLVHMGEAIAPAFRFVPRFIQWIEQGYDVYTDTSIVPGFAPAWLIHELLAHGLGVDRVLFATDSPWGRYPSEYWKVEGLEIEDKLKEQIFWKNAARLYRLDNMQ